MILVHGFAQAPASWDEVAKLLPEDAELRIPELPGHGETALTLGEPSPELVREVLLREIESLDQAPVLWGYSMGARIGFDFLVNHPGRLRAAILESGTPGIEDPLARAERRSRDFALSKRLESGTIEEFVDNWERLPAIGEQSVDVIAKQRPIRLSHDTHALAAALRGIGQASFDPVWDRLGEIDLPVLLMSGADDPLYEAHADHLAKLLPRAQRSSIAGAGHAAHISKPAEATAAVNQFLAEL